MRLVVEKISEDFAILEKDDLSHIQVDISLMPSGLKEGNILIYDGKEYHIDTEAEEQIRKRIIQKQRSIFKR